MRIASLKNGRERTSFVGRVRERWLLLDHLDRGEGFIVLSGPSGMGKTRLARQVTREVVDTFDLGGGAWFCDLAGCHSASDLVGVVARTLEVPQTQGELTEAIAARGRMLLLLDDVDSLDPQMGAVLGRWLERCSELQVMMTSIVPFPLDGGTRVELGPLTEEDAITLYMERAHQACADMEWSGGEASELEELVRRLDRMPLAIELAAARMRILPPSILLSKLDQRFELLRPARSAHKSSLTEAFTLTWELLDERERSFLAKASVFEGGFTREAAAVVGGARTLAETLQILEGLSSKSLLSFDDGEPPRLQLLESVQRYAQIELGRAGLREETLRSHASYFVEEGRVHERRVTERQDIASMRWLKREHANLLAIHRRFLITDPALAAKAGLAIAPLLIFEGAPSSESDRTDAILDAARRSGAPELIALALSTRTRSLYQYGRVEEAQVVNAEALALTRSLGDKMGEAQCLVWSATLHMRQGSGDASISLLNSAMEIGRAFGLPAVEAGALATLGSLAFNRLSLGEAEVKLQRAAQLFRASGLQVGEMKALSFLGQIWANQGRFVEARRVHLDGLELSRAMGDRMSEAIILSNHGWIDLLDGRLDEAERSYQEGLALLRRLGSVLPQGKNLSNLGVIALERGDLELAEERLAQAEVIFAEAGILQHLGELLAFVAMLEARRGRIREARRALDEAKAIFAGDETLGVIRTGCAEAAIEVAEARSLAPTDRDAARDRIALARAHLASLRARHGGMATEFVMARLLEQDLANWDAASSAPTRSLRVPAPSFHVSSTADWFEIDGSPRAVVGDRLALHRIFGALVSQRLEDPGVTLDALRLAERGWPGAKAQPDAVMKRLYLAIWTLRELGLREVLVKKGEGYLLDPRVPLVLQDGSAPPAVRL